MKITKGREKNPWDIACSCNVVLPRNSENTYDKQGTRDKKIPAKPPDELTTTRPQSNLGGET